MGAKRGLDGNVVASLPATHMVNDNWKSPRPPSYQLPARDVGFCLLGRRFSASTQSVSIKIFRPAQISAGSCQKAWERVKSEGRRLLLSSLKLDVCQRNGNGVGSNASEVKNELALEIARPLHRHLGLFQRLINEQRALLDLFNWILEVGRRAFA